MTDRALGPEVHRVIGLVGPTRLAVQASPCLEQAPWRPPLLHEPAHESCESVHELVVHVQTGIRIGRLLLWR
jgi:hypothetical protein